MSSLPSFRRIVEQDYPQEDQELVRLLASSLNYGIEVLYSLLNGKLTIKDNLASTIKEIDVKVGTNGVPLTNTVIKKTSNDKIEGLIVVRANNLTNSSVYPSSGVTISYTETTDTIIINHITGLQANNIYRINVIALR